MIKNLKAKEILDSRRNPTVEVELTTDSGIFLASVPSGASKGEYEAVELRDGGKRYNGMGVLKAVNNVNKIIAPKLIGKDPTKQKEIDNFLNPEKFGANATTPVSMAVCRAGAGAENLPLYKYISEIYRGRPPAKNVRGRPPNIFTLSIPKACFNVINGGVHAGNELDFQEFMIVPLAEAWQKSQKNFFQKSLQRSLEIYQELKNIIKEKYIDLAINIGDEGGFAPPVRAPEEAIELILKAAKNLGYQDEMTIILDVAASQFYKKGNYKMKIGTFTREGLLNYYSRLIEKYPIIGGIEDPFSQDDWKGWQLFKSKVKSQKSKVLIIGDDLLATNPKRIKMAREKKACNAAIIKINQIGTITGAIEAARLVKNYGWEIIVSHRSGETMDDFIADLAVGIGADFIKSGAPSQPERLAKYNRLLKIEKELK